MLEILPKEGLCGEVVLLSNLLEALVCVEQGMADAVDDHLYNPTGCGAPGDTLDEGREIAWGESEFVGIESNLSLVVMVADKGDDELLEYACLTVGGKEGGNVVGEIVVEHLEEESFLETEYLLGQDGGLYASALQLVDSGLAVGYDSAQLLHTFHLSFVEVGDGLLVDGDEVGRIDRTLEVGQREFKCGANVQNPEVGALLEEPNGGGGHLDEYVALLHLVLLVLVENAHGSLKAEEEGGCVEDLIDGLLTKRVECRLVNGNPLIE